MKKIGLVCVVSVVLVVVTFVWNRNLDQRVERGLKDAGYGFSETVLERDGFTLQLSGFVKDRDASEKAEAFLIERFPSMFLVDNRLGIVAEPKTLPPKNFAVRIQRTDRVRVTGNVPDVRTLDYTMGLVRDSFDLPVIDQLKIVRGNPVNDLRSQIQGAIRDSQLTYVADEEPVQVSVR